MAAESSAPIGRNLSTLQRRAAEQDWLDCGHCSSYDGGTDDPQPHFLKAIAEHARASRPVAQARTQLAYGEFLRRSGRRVDARAQLRAALDAFTEVGARSWADRVRQELRASGETARNAIPRPHCS